MLRFASAGGEATTCHPERSARRARGRGIPRTANAANRPQQEAGGRGRGVRSEGTSILHEVASTERTSPCSTGFLPRVGDSRRAIFGVDIGPVGLGLVPRLVMVKRAAVETTELLVGAAANASHWVCSHVPLSSTFVPPHASRAPLPLALTRGPTCAYEACWGVFSAFILMKS